MRFVAGVLLLAVAVGFAARGRLSGLAGLHVAWAPLAAVGLLLQWFTPGGNVWPFACLMVSFVLLGVFAARNLKVPGFALILAGVSMNFLVIALNHGMPVTENALVRSGQQATLTELVRDGGVKHHLSSPDDRLLFLADVTPIPPPIAQIVSVGDILAYAGLGYVIVAAMRRGRRDGVSGDESTEALERVPIGAGVGEGADG